MQTDEQFKIRLLNGAFWDEDDVEMVVSRLAAIRAIDEFLVRCERGGLDYTPADCELVADDGTRLSYDAARTPILLQLVIEKAGAEFSLNERIAILDKLHALAGPNGLDLFSVAKRYDALIGGSSEEFAIQFMTAYNQEVRRHY